MLQEEPLSSQRAGIHPSPGLSSSLGLKQPKIMEQKKDKIGKIPTWNIAHSPAGLAGRVVLGTGLKLILQLLLSNSVRSSTSPCTAGGTSGCRRGQEGPSWEGIGASIHPGDAREGCHQPLRAAPQPSRKVFQLYFPARSRISPADKPNTEHNTLPGSVCLKSCGNGIQKSSRPTGSFFAQPNP